MSNLIKKSWTVSSTYLSISEVVNYEDCKVEKSIKRTLFEPEWNLMSVIN